MHAAQKGALKEDEARIHKVGKMKSFPPACHCSRQRGPCSGHNQRHRRRCPQSCTHWSPCPAPQPFPHHRPRQTQCRSGLLSSSRLVRCHTCAALKIFGASTAKQEDLADIPNGHDALPHSMLLLIVHGECFVLETFYYSCQWRTTMAAKLPNNHKQCPVEASLPPQYGAWSTGCTVI